MLRWFCLIIYIVFGRCRTVTAIFRNIYHPMNGDQKVTSNAVSVGFGKDVSGSMPFVTIMIMPHISIIFILIPSSTV